MGRITVMVAAAAFALLSAAVAVSYSEDTNPVVAAVCQPSAESVEQLFAPVLNAGPRFWALASRRM